MTERFLKFAGVAVFLAAVWVLLAQPVTNSISAAAQNRLQFVLGVGSTNLTVFDLNTPNQKLVLSPTPVIDTNAIVAAVLARMTNLAADIRGTNLQITISLK